jgi:hypothetical protein
VGVRNQDMLVMLWLYWPLNAPAPAELRESTSVAANQVRMTPLIWNMAPEH